MKLHTYTRTHESRLARENTEWLFNISSACQLIAKLNERRVQFCK